MKTIKGTLINCYMSSYFLPSKLRLESEKREKVIFSLKGKFLDFQKFHLNLKHFLSKINILSAKNSCQQYIPVDSGPCFFTPIKGKLQQTKNNKTAIAFVKAAEKFWYVDK